MKASGSTANVSDSVLSAAGTSTSPGLWFSMFNRAARSLFLLAAFVGLQGSGMFIAPCATGVHQAEHPAAVIGGPPHGITDAHSMPETAEPSLPHESGRGMPCEHSSMPEGCMMMAACTAFVAAIGAELTEPAVPSGKGMVLVVRKPAFESVAPDVPPPRVVQSTT